jgi:DNA-binding NarL/FixJ family response regulator
MCNPTILVIDNRVDLLASTKSYMKAKSPAYVVLTAEDEQAALNYCQQEVVHLAVIDISLRHDGDQEDWSGLQLANKLDRSIAKIILTGNRYDEPEDLVRRVLGIDEEGNIPADAFVWKREGPGALLKAIQRVLQRRNRLNPALKIVKSKELNLGALIEQLKLFRDSDPDTKSKAEAVLKDLICRLFYQARAVNLLRTTPGQGHCTVALVQPVYDEAPGAELAIKIGPWEDIEQEVKNYNQFVKPHIGFRSTNLREGPVKSREMGAVAYEFVGEEVDSLTNFGEYYNRSDIKNETLNVVLENLFRKGCGKWYRATRPPLDSEQKRLDQLYREQLNLLDKPHVQALKNKYDELLSQWPVGRQTFTSADGMLRVQLDGRPPLTLPDPLAFALEEMSSDAGSTFFPLPSKMSITHGDLHSGNILVSELGRTWLIDFFKTGKGHALRDFAELEIDIKFNLLKTMSMRVRYDLERVLLAPTTLNEEIVPAANFSAEQIRATVTIQQLRKLAYELTDTEGVREYYIGLLFYALKRIVGFTSSSGSEQGNQAAPYHAILSAAILCKRLVDDSRERYGLDWGKIKGESQIFLSYARSDNEEVRPIYQRLLDEGFKPWRDLEDILPGEKWQQSINEAIKRSDIFLACLTRNSVDRRGFIQKEIRMALDICDGMLDNDIYFIPVMLEECPIPERLRVFQAVRLFEPDGWQQFTKAIQEGIFRRKKGPGA